MKTKLLLLTVHLIFAISFHLNAHVGLVYPEGGEVFNAGETITIQWEIVVEHNTQNWDLYFSADGGANWETIALDIDVDQLSYDWVVPDIGTAQGRVHVIMDNAGNNYFDESGNFTIENITGIIQRDRKSGISVYPNPMNDHTTISFPEYQDKNINFVMYNATGITVRNIENIADAKLYLERENLLPGIYFFQLLADNKTLVTGKLIVSNY